MKEGGAWAEDEGEAINVGELLWFEGNCDCYELLSV